MFSLILVQTKQTQSRLHKIENIFNKINLIGLQYKIRNLTKRNVKTQHLSLLKSPHVHKKAMSQYAVQDGIIFKLDIHGLSVPANQGFARSQLKVFLRDSIFLNKGIASHSEATSKAVLACTRQLSLNYIELKTLKLKIPLVFSVYL